MKVKDLIEKLQKYPEDMEVVIDGTFDPNADIGGIVKLKIERKRFESGAYYYLIYEWSWFHWVRRSGLFGALEEAEQCAVNILEDEKERRKIKREKPVYYKLEGNKISYNKGDGIERGILGEPPLKLKKSS